MYSGASLLHPTVDGLMMKLDQFAGSPLQLRADRNKADASMMTVMGARPDCCIWKGQALVFKGEEKSDAVSLHHAVKELGDKMAREWNPLTCGSMPYLLCYAAAGPKLQFHLVMRDTDVALPISVEYNLSDVSLSLCSAVSMPM